MIHDGCGIGSAVQFWENKTVAEDEVLSYIWDHPGEMTQVEIYEKFGLPPQELISILERLSNIRFIREENGKVFPTLFAAAMIKAYEAYERLEKFYEEAPK